MEHDRNNKQLNAWTGDFGDSYTDRNSLAPEKLSARTMLWSNIFRCFQNFPPKSVLEVGSNVGTNLCAIQSISSADLFAVEPNVMARKKLVNSGVVSDGAAKLGVVQKIPFDDNQIEMVFTSGVLIHVHPRDLEQAVSEICRVASRYVVCIEYFADKPVSEEYRGGEDLLFKRDFGAFYLEKCANLRALDYGFAWKKVTGLDNLTWWVFQKDNFQQ